MKNNQEIKISVHINFYKKIEKFANERLMDVEGLMISSVIEYIRRHDEPSSKLASKLQESLDELKLNCID